MVSTSLLLFSIGLWLAAAWVALSCIRLTRRKTAWISVAIALLLMAGWSAAGFLAPAFSHGQPVSPGFTEISALLVSALMLAGILLIRSYLSSLHAVGRALEKSEANLRRAQEVAGMGSWNLDMATNTLTWSDETHRMFGVPSGTHLTYEAFLGCVHPDDRSLVDCEWKAALSGAPYDIKHRIVVNGKAAWVRERAEVECDGMGRALRATGTVQDITEKRASEEEMRLLRAAVECAAESVIVTDAAGTILYVNPAFERVSGYAKEEAVGKNPRILKSGRQDAALYRAMWNTLTGGGVWSGVFVNRRKDGALYEEETLISPIRDAKGRIGHYVAVKRDVTIERSLEAQVAQAQRLESLGVLAGGIAHDFNNTLSACMGYTDLLAKELASNERLSRYTDRMEKVISNSSRLVQQLLAIGRRQAVSPRPMSLSAAVLDMEDMLGRLIDKGIRLETSLAPDTGTVCADPGQIEQVIMNLVVNARDAMPDGGTITIETANVLSEEDCGQDRPSGRPGEHVLLSVSDNGTGMDEATRARIFEPFFTTKENGKGTGLGLAVVYGIVKQSGGRIRVCSVPGLGTTFRIYFPIWGDRRTGGDADSVDPRFGSQCTQL